MDVQAYFEEYRKYRKQKKVPEALEALEMMVQQLRPKEKPCICANHLLEFYLVEYYFKTRDYETQTYPIHQMYYSPAKILMERMHFADALELLEKAREWNPVDLDILWAVTECQKQLEQYDVLVETTKAIHPFIYTRADMAHYYRNLGFYYLEQYEPDPAMILYYYSNLFSHSKAADSEIAYLEKAMHKNCPEYTVEELERELKRLNIPSNVSETTMAILYRAGQLEWDGGDRDAAEDCLRLLYELTGDKEIGKMLERDE